MRFVAVVLLCLAACRGVTPAPNLQPFELAAGAAVADAWKAVGLAAPTQLPECRVERFYVRLDSARDYGVDCASTPEASAGCLNWLTDKRWVGNGPEYPVVVISPLWKSEPGIIVHELLHAYERCSGLEAGKHNESDSTHSDARVWTAAGGASAAQSVAMASLVPSTPSKDPGP